MLSRRYGLGLVRAHPFADATVTGSIQGAFTTAPATEYLVLVEGAIAGTASSDEALILAWDAAGADSIDVVTPVGGVWSTTITLAVDALSVATTSEARTVYLIRQSTGQAIATLAVVARWATPNDIIDSVSGQRLTRGAWPCASETGVVSVSSASVNADLSAWSQTNADSWAGNQTDPDDGTAAYLFTETTDGGSATHSTYIAAANATASYCDIIVWLKAADRDWVVIVFGNYATNYVYLNITAGTVGNTLGASATLLGSSGAWQCWKIRSRAIPSGTNAYVYSASGNGLVSYTGNSTACFYMYSPTLIQHRSSGVADQSLTVLGAARGADLLQATPANQPLWGKDGWIDDLTPPGSSNSRPVLALEANRAQEMTTAHADVTGLFSGINPQYAVAFIGSIVGNGAYLLFTDGGAGSAYDAPLRISGTTVQTARRDSTTTSSQDFPGITSADTADFAVYVVIRMADRTTQLWKNGILISTAPALADLGSATHTSTGVDSKVAIPRETRYADLAIYAIDGTKTGAQIYAELRAAHARSIAAFGVAA